MRGREIERNTDTHYLATLSDDYENAMSAFEQNNPDVTILRYDGDEIDFVQNKQHLNRILSEVQESMLKRSM